jgi:hypothetical protein
MYANAFGNSFSRASYNYLNQQTSKREYIPGIYLAQVQQELNSLIFISRIPKEFDDSDMMELLKVRTSAKERPLNRKPVPSHMLR